MSKKFMVIPNNQIKKCVKYSICYKDEKNNKRIYFNHKFDD